MMRVLTKHSIFLAELSALTISPLVGAPAMSPAQTPISEQQAHAIAVDAYVYFYSLIMMDVTRLQAANIEPGKEVGKSLMNTFSNVAEYPPTSFKLVVRPF
jgi:hypothetical protein